MNLEWETFLKINHIKYAETSDWCILEMRTDFEYDVSKDTRL